MVFYFGVCSELKRSDNWIESVNFARSRNQVYFSVTPAHEPWYKYAQLSSVYQIWINTDNNNLLNLRLSNIGFSGEFLHYFPPHARSAIFRLGMCSRRTNLMLKEDCEGSVIEKAESSSRKDYPTELCVPETALIVISWNSRQISFGLAFLSVTAVYAPVTHSLHCDSSYFENRWD